MEATGNDDGREDERPKRGMRRWMAERRRLRRMIDLMAAQIAEHCDSVEIVVTMRNPIGGTEMMSRGKGNHYARAASLREWVVMEDARTRRDAVGE